MIFMSNKYLYTGDSKYQPEPEPNRKWNRLCTAYQPDAELVRAVNLAIYLERPLLLQGEPGCGKTQLASAVAYELSRTLNVDKNKYPEYPHYPFFPWYVKSTSRARDGLYTYDAVARLRDAQFANSEHIADKEKIIERLQDSEQTAYINYGPLGQAFRCPLRAVVLTL